MLDQINEFLDFCLLNEGLSENTLEAYRYDLTHFMKFINEQDSTLSFLEINAAEIQTYLALRYTRKTAARSNARFLSSLRHFYAWAKDQGYTHTNPVINIELPKLNRLLPTVISESQVESLLNMPDTDSAVGLRDRAMLELLYSSGLRVSELVSLTLSMIEASSGIIKIIGKGDKERLTPMGETANSWLQEYLQKSRPQLLKSSNSPYVFLSQKGGAMTRQAFWYRIKKYAEQAGVSQNLSPHTLRHAFATHLLNHGADLRVVQMLLGHSSISTTTIYTQVATSRLQKLYEEHHPRAKMRK